jgi:hypothetical protein
MSDLNRVLDTLSEKIKGSFLENTNSSSMEKKDTRVEEKEPPTSGDELYTPVKMPAKVGRVQIFAALLNGLGVGLLLGILLGLAVSPVVSAVIGTLSSILLVLLGLNDKHLSTLKSLRIGAFGIFAAAGIILGMYIRVNDALAPSPVQLKESYMESGFTKQQALYYTALKKFKYVPLGWFGTSAADTVARSLSDNYDKSVLFASKVNLGACRVLNDADATFPKSELLYTFEAAGGVWEALATAIKPILPDQIFVDAMLGLRDSFCKRGASGIIEMTVDAKLAQLSEDTDLEIIKKTMHDSGANWTAIIDNTENKIPVQYQSQFYLTIIKIYGDETQK